MTNYANPTDSATMVLMLNCGWSLDAIGLYFMLPTPEVIALIRASTKADRLEEKEAIRSLR
jgi:hypothetical protein